VAKQKSAQEVISQTRAEEFADQCSDIEFKIQMMCLSIVRFVSDYIAFLPIGVLNHLVCECDILCVLAPLIELKPWLRTGRADRREVYEGQKWTIVEPGEYARLPRLEAQVWITIYNLFMNPQCRGKYELSDFRKSNLLRVRPTPLSLLLAP